MHKDTEEQDRKREDSGLREPKEYSRNSRNNGANVRDDLEKPSKKSECESIRQAEKKIADIVDPKDKKHHEELREKPLAHFGLDASGDRDDIVLIRLRRQGAEEFLDAILLEGKVE